MSSSVASQISGGPGWQLGPSKADLASPGHRWQVLEYSTAWPDVTTPIFFLKAERSVDVKLLTHNLLSSHVRGVGPRGFPLCLQATEVRINPVEFNPNFVAHMIPKVEWAVLLEAADILHLVEVPKEPIQGYEHDEKFLRKMHHILLEVDVLEGTLQCPESGRLFLISHGIPNMLLNDEETET
ncbi:multifunctional methyltransferase subunit TRM112-like protein [Hippopotamus amphibius kiboko]|uniref:multifunctional methyltransferase subunit TRM112-like protein n=1 Tax=Hippopotamus amphibius kiboko TaxID=575201 RepID=UPI0025978A61|nr:multifunctional methyltransferase subunit TRM112-like protein [Hippopotamus amphibius kiboko]